MEEARRPVNYGRVRPTGVKALTFNKMLPYGRVAIVIIKFTCTVPN